MRIRNNDRLVLAGAEVANEADLVALYRRQLEVLGASSESLFYRNEEQHQQKLLQFGKLLRTIVSPSNSILDIGCGFGSLVPHLPVCRYTGVDLVAEFVAIARERYPGFDLRSGRVEDVTASYDWSVLAGVLSSTPKPEETLASAWRLCSRGVLADFVDARKLPPEWSELNHFDLGSCVSYLLELGADRLDVFPTPNVWTIVVAWRSGSPWAVEKSRDLSLEPVAIGWSPPNSA